MLCCCCCCCCCAVAAGVAAASTTGVSSASVIVISVFALLISLYSPAFFLLHSPRSLSLALFLSCPLPSPPRIYGSMDVITYLALSPATQPSPVPDFPWQLPIFQPLRLYRFCILELCRRLGRRFLVLGRRLVAARVLILLLWWWKRRWWWWWWWVWWRLKRRRGCGIWLLYGSVRERLVRRGGQ